jgi:hypothetical protein
MIQDARACSTHPAFVTNQTHSQNAGALEVTLGSYDGSYDGSLFGGAHAGQRFAYLWAGREPRVVTRLRMLAA